MTSDLKIEPSRPVQGTIRPPGSKSITNRALVCAALAQGDSQLTGALDSDDTRVMIEALRELGIGVDVSDTGRTLLVQGCGGRPSAVGAELFVGNSGTTIRFLTALVTLGQGTFRLDGVERMRERPIGDLLAALKQLGADVQCEAGNDCPPVVVRASGLSGGRATVKGNISSQFLSGLLMTAPCAQRPVELVIDGQLVSQPYVHMTLAVMAAFGVQVDAGNLTRFTIDTKAGYRGSSYAIEPDASAASYFFGAAAVTGGEVTIAGLSRDSLQGDVAFIDVLEQMGCRVKRDRDSITVTGGKLRGVTIDMNAISDTVQTLGAVALFADGPTTVTGVAHIRHKETDRIGAMAIELRKLGATVEEHHDGLTIIPGSLHGATLHTYDDHRMAMSLALAGLRIPGVVIRDPECTSKTYPGYWDDLAKICTPSHARG